MLKVWWFSELLPEYKILEEKILDIVKNSYRQYGYTPIETPGVEQNKILTAKWWWEVNNQIFGVYWLAQWSNDLKDYSLRFDLTVPFSRYVLDYRWELTFPFKRSQIQKVWRWERQQRWRSREFYQADVDVIWQDEAENKKDYLFYDSECIFVVFNTLQKIFIEFWIEDKAKININNRKILSWFIGSLWLSNEFPKIAIIIDKIDKISKEKFEEELENIWIQKSKVEIIFKFLRYNINLENIDNLEKEFEIKDSEFLSWIEELKKVLSNLKALWMDENNISVNLSIIRWLGYYTGTVFETFIESDRKLWSVWSGWRYEKLTTYIDPKTSYSWVGFSLWITRLEEFLFEKIEKEKLKKTTSEYMVVNFETTFVESLNLYKKLILSWKSVEFYPEPDKLVKQFKYADKKGIKYVVVYWEDEVKAWKYILKNLESWESEEVIL